jgi:hypothetical protein
MNSTSIGQILQNPVIIIPPSDDFLDLYGREAAIFLVWSVAREAAAEFENNRHSQINFQRQTRRAGVNYNGRGALGGHLKFPGKSTELRRFSKPRASFVSGVSWHATRVIFRFNRTC